MCWWPQTITTFQALGIVLAAALFWFASLKFNLSKSSIKWWNYKPSGKLLTILQKKSKRSYSCPFFFGISIHPNVPRNQATTKQLQWWLLLLLLILLIPLVHRRHRVLYGTLSNVPPLRHNILSTCLTHPRPDDFLSNFDILGFWLLACFGALATGNLLMRVSVCQVHL
jgi:hypothetical protein